MLNITNRVEHTAGNQRKNAEIGQNCFKQMETIPTEIGWTLAWNQWQKAEIGWNIA